jgi:hypothetical protein
MNTTKHRNEKIKFLKRKVGGERSLLIWFARKLGFIFLFSFHLPHLITLTRHRHHSKRDIAFGMIYGLNRMFNYNKSSPFHRRRLLCWSSSSSLSLSRLPAHSSEYIIDHQNQSHEALRHWPSLTIFFFKGWLWYTRNVDSMFHNIDWKVKALDERARFAFWCLQQ